MSSNQAIVEQLIELLEHYASQPAMDEVAGYNFVTNGALDSFSLLSFISDIEEHFQIAFTPEELTHESMQTLAGMASAVLGKQSGSEAGMREGG